MFADLQSRDLAEDEDGGPELLDETTTGRLM